MKDILNNIIYMARRFKLSTAFNLIGLTVAFAAFYLFMTQVSYQLSYNHGIEDYRHLYRMESDFVFNEWQFTDMMSRPFASALDSMPEVESYSIALNTEINSAEFYRLTFKKGDQEVRYTATRGNDKVLSTLTSQALSGSIEWSPDDREGIIIPASIAREYFGTTAAAGDSMLYCYKGEDGETLTYPMAVRGVFEDFPAASELQNIIYLNLGDEDLYSPNFLYKCIVKFKDYPDDIDAFGQRLKQQINDMMSSAYRQAGYEDEISVITKSVNNTTIKFTPLAESYFEHSSFTTSDNGYAAMLYIMIAAAVLVVVIATINFFNFCLAESPMRIRSINTRLVLGASRGALRRGLIMECVVIAVTSCLLALVLCHLVQYLPSAALLTEGSLALTAHWPLVLTMLVMAVGVGIAAGAYPASFATSFPPAIAIKRSFGLTPQGKRLRSTLLCLQLSISLLMVIYMGSLYLQSRYIFNIPYGYDNTQILVADVPYSIDAEAKAQLVDQLQRSPLFTSATLSNSPLGNTDGHSVLRTEKEDELVRYSYMLVEPNYMTTMGIKMLEGHDFTPADTNSIIINRASQEKWDWIKIGSRISTGIGSTDSAVVIGVCDNIRYGTLRIVSNKPFFFIYSAGDNYLCYLNAHIAPNADREQARKQFSELIKKYCGRDDIPVNTFDDDLIKAYRNEFRFINLMFIIAMISVLCTIIGVICLSQFEAEYRRKEIGIRKVAGATTGEIIGMFTRYYVRLILLSFAIAALPAYFISQLTLNYFALHTAIHWWIFPLSLLIVGGITLGIVLTLSLRTARENPVTSIKTE